jgi:hypothetical protein
MVAMAEVLGVEGGEVGDVLTGAIKDASSFFFTRCASAVD